MTGMRELKSVTEFGVKKGAFMYQVKWEEFMNHILQIDYNTIVHFNEDESDEDYDEDCILCPECEEFIYKEDFPTIKADDQYYYCPICEAGY